MEDNDHDYVVSPADLSVEAALELEELKQGLRADVPALSALFHYLRTPAPSFEGQNSISMLADVRAYALLRDSLPKKNSATNRAEFAELIDRYLRNLEEGIAKHKSEEIEEAKRFCLSLNNRMIARQMDELYSRRERADARNFDNESLP